MHVTAFCIGQLLQQLANAATASTLSVFSGPDCIVCNQPLVVYFFYFFFSRCLLVLLYSCLSYIIDIIKGRQLDRLMPFWQPAKILHSVLIFMLLWQIHIVVASSMMFRDMLAHVSMIEAGAASSCWYRRQMSCTMHTLCFIYN